MDKTGQDHGKFHVSERATCFLCVVTFFALVAAALIEHARLVARRSPASSGGR